MKSVVIKRSILINGRKTSVSLENEFWDALHEIAEHENVAISALVEKINEGRNNINLSSAIRVFVFNHYRPINGKEAKQNPHSERRSLLARAGECRAGGGAVHSIIGGHFCARHERKQISRR